MASSDEIPFQFKQAKPTPCNKCGEVFPSLTQFNAHRATCKKHKCTMCDLRFVTGAKLKEHTKTHRVCFRCDECDDEPFQSKSALDQHKLWAHNVIITCPHCPQTFKWATHRDEHVRGKHGNDGVCNACACGQTYVKKWQLDRHEQECPVSKIGAKIAVKRKFSELIAEESRIEYDASAIALQAFDMVREAAEKKIKAAAEKKIEAASCEFVCGVCQTKLGNNESLKRHMRKMHPRV